MTFFSIHIVGQDDLLTDRDGRYAIVEATTPFVQVETYYFDQGIGKNRILGKVDVRVAAIDFVGWAQETGFEAPKDDEETD